VKRRVTSDQRERLAGYERTIERGLATFVEVGQALLAVLDEGLYVERYGTFEAYTRYRWGLSYSAGDAADPGRGRGDADRSD